MQLQRVLVAAVVLTSLTVSAAAARTGATPEQDGIWRTSAAVMPAAPPQIMLESVTRTDEDLTATDLAGLGKSRSTSDPMRQPGLERRGSLVRLVFEVTAGQRESVADRITTLGGDIEISYGRMIQAWVPQSEVASLQRWQVAVTRVRPPALFVPSGSIGEGVTSTNTPAWQEHGLSGEGVKVAIFDGGFGGLAERQAAGEIPPTATVADFCGGRASGPETHGTAVAEIVADVAPSAQLFLVCADTDVSLGPALEFAKANGVQVVNMSGGFFNTWRGDGSGPAGTPDAIVAAAHASNITWVNSAGNEALTHWGGKFASGDGDPLADFASNDEVNSVLVPAGQTVCGFLRWDEWPIAATDLDLGFYDGQVGVVDVAERDQIGDRLDPTEELCLTNISGATRAGGFFVYRYAGAGTPDIDLFVTGDLYDVPIEHSTAARSVVDPAASPNTVTAGAVCWQSGLLESYSSQGPTIDNRIKPDLAGPDSVTSPTYGPFTGCGTSGFAGTSASSPHVAGAAALLRERYPTLPVAELQTLLLKETADAGVAGNDTAYGAGRLAFRELPQAVLKAMPATVRRGKNAFLRFSVDKAQWDVRNHVHVFRGSTQIGSFDLTYAHQHQRWRRSVRWHAPGQGSAASRFRFCVEGWDRANHPSKRSCAQINVR